MSTSIEYIFVFPEAELEDLSYKIDTQQQGGKALRKSTPASWTQLANHQCSICPLKHEAHCPAALDIEQIIDDFKGMPAYKKIEVQVLTPERNISKQTGLEEGLRSLMGLIMANSDCPILSKLKLWLILIYLFQPMMSL